MDIATYSKIFATSLRRMSAFYNTPSYVTHSPDDAVKIALLDTAVTAEKAAEGLVWESPDKWVPFVEAETPAEPAES